MVPWTPPEKRENGAEGVAENWAGERDQEGILGGGRGEEERKEVRFG